MNQSQTLWHLTQFIFHQILGRQHAPCLAEWAVVIVSADMFNSGSRWKNLLGANKRHNNNNNIIIIMKIIIIKFRSLNRNTVQNKVVRGCKVPPFYIHLRVWVLRAPDESDNEPLPAERSLLRWKWLVTCYVPKPDTGVCLKMAQLFFFFGCGDHFLLREHQYVTTGPAFHCRHFLVCFLWLKSPKSESGRAEWEKAKNKVTV